MRTRQDLNEWEQRHLAPWAARSAATRGRAHPEDEHPMRSPFERDRDRIIHSSAFRRLEYKTQVFVTHAGDFYRTRLTHTLEVTQITRSVARLLGLNEDLAEAIALVHDLGHPPFGHAGEKALQEEMASHGGFEHNHQGLRLVTLLEQRYPRFPGLNLTWEVREGIAKHSHLFDPENVIPDYAEFGDAPRPSLEAQVADACDQIAYNAHDVDDGVAAGMISLEDLEQLAIWRAVRGDWEQVAGLTAEQRKYLGVRAMINAQVTDLATTTEARAAEWGIHSPDEARVAPGTAAALSPPMQAMNDELRKFLFANVYRDYRQTRMWHKARRVIASMFDALVSAPEQLPPAVAARVEANGLERAICDYLASLTDREALQEHGRLFEL